MGLKTHEVNPTGYRISCGILAVPDHGGLSRFNERVIEQYGHSLPEYIENLEASQRWFRQLERNGCRGPERIRIVLKEFDATGQFLMRTDQLFDG